MNYDSAIITAILVFDMMGGTASVACAWLTWRMLQERQRNKIRGTVNKALRHLGFAARV
jgi:hypothetical protein